MHRFKPQSLTFKKSLLIGLSALSLVACGGGGSSNSGDGNGGGGNTDSKKTVNLSVIIDSPIKTKGLMLKNVASGADNTPFAIAKTTASTLDISNKIAKGSDYDIKVAQQPEGFEQFCYIEQGKGTFSNTDIAIQLKCVAGAAKVSTYAGKGTNGNTNGNGLSAQFKYPSHIVFDSKGNLFIADQYNHQIRKITPQGVVSTFAGSGTAGSVDGTGAAASFKRPVAIAVDKADNLYVGGNNYCVRKITPQAVVTTLAGQCGTRGDVPVKTGFNSNTTTGITALFKNIYGMVYDGDNALYVVDYDNRLIRKISINDGTSATARVQNIIATGSGNVSMGLSADKKTLYYISASDYKLYQVDLTSTNQPKPKTALTTTAGNGFKNGDFAVAQFSSVYNQLIASKSGQFLYLVDRSNNRIRRIDLSNQSVSTLAGSGTHAVTDGIGTLAAFSSPNGIAQDAQGNLFVSSQGSVIRKLELVKQP